jgi:hypothetical protein
VRGLAHRIGNIGVQSVNPLTLEDFYWLVVRTAYTIGPISADQHKQIGIRRGASSFPLRGGFIKQNLNLKKCTGIKYPIRKI